MPPAKIHLDFLKLYLFIFARKMLQIFVECESLMGEK